jgi:uncharacterized protein (TIGR02246 family)
MTRSPRISAVTAIAMVSVGLLFGGCPAPEPVAEEIPVADTSAANLNAIRALHGTFMEAYNRGDIETLAGLFTQDAIRMPPFGVAFQGEAAIRADFASIFGQNDGDISITVDETRLSGDFAIARGTWAVSLTPKNGDAVTTDVGKWLNLLERQTDGSWKISRNIWNSDRAPTG